MRKTIKHFILFLTAAMMTIAGALPVCAATAKYGEDKPLRTVKTLQLTVKTGHKHKYVDASNGCRYQFYDSCMNGMIGSVPTNHLSTITIDGVKYSLRNYRSANGNSIYANVIKKTGGTTVTYVVKKIPLQKISLNKTSMSMNVGTSSQLSVSYQPVNTTDSKSVIWTSSNSSVASVSSGRVSARKAGTATITAWVGAKTASCKVTVKSSSTGTGSTTGSTSVGSYKNVSDAYTLLNNFRTTRSNQWYWNSTNTKKITTYGLKSLTRNVALENVAKIRAKEQWTMNYQRNLRTHTRPDGRKWSTAYPSGLQCMGENLAWGHTTSRSVILDPEYGWAETNLKYSGQGHRRNMLDSRFTKVGIACYVKDGKTCWAMSLGK